MSLIAHGISYTHPDGTACYTNLSLTINRGDKVAIVGRNGSGKSTLLRQLLEADTKMYITRDMTYYYMPQDTTNLQNSTVAEVLHVADKLEALHRLLQGEVDMALFDCLGDDWGIEERIEEEFHKLAIGYLGLDRLFSSLSGGEQVKVMLAGIALSNAQLVVLDEPTNHLDSNTRALLYSWFRKTKKTLLLVSHDKELLNLMTGIYELSPLGLNYYSGNYTAYEALKEQEQAALRSSLKSGENRLKKGEERRQKVAERRDRIVSRGYDKCVKKGLGKLQIDYKRDRAEKTSTSIKNSIDAKMENTEARVAQLKERVAGDRFLKMKLDSPPVIVGKELVVVEDFNKCYPDSHHVWEEGLSFTIKQGDRLELSGPNGSGKSTLLKGIKGTLKEFEGEVINRAHNSCYIDQSISQIDLGLTVIEQAEQVNRGLTPAEVRTILHRSQLTSEMWGNSCSTLSGGEWVKLLFACLQIAHIAPDLILLDEPTNNLDLSSIEVLTETLRDYRGTLVVVSHDRTFVRELKCNKQIKL